MNDIFYADIRDFAPHFDALYRTARAERRARADRCPRDAALACLVSGALLTYAADRAGITGYTLSKNPAGKPQLEDHPALHFNLSHSGLYAAIAWGNAPVGIDVEMLRHREAMPRLAQRHFTAAEQEYAKTTTGFYEIWTAKESYLKFLGTGIDRPLRSFCTRSPGISRLLKTFFPEEDCVLTVCAEAPFAAPLRISPEKLLK